VVIGYTATYHMVSDTERNIKLIILFLVVYGKKIADCGLPIWEEEIEKLRD
jgi:hypothetical protein